ncbi:ferritin-like domain-containing protein [Sphingomonas abietis]|uniref:Ferritin-like domain-containing protein n=1 Tax=Sphingomonas abietis TaxID=3012344 RepID=A0ABY7NNG2_9SPHN|nr:ferritin-like domain-containing protein [Sphingomonas abietis]WBO22021.1 ferritin-like domain-containing protein [Sphingomonas abietis]
MSVSEEMRIGREGVASATSIAQACRAVLLTADPIEKAFAARAAQRAWQQGRLAFLFDVAMPDDPPRPADLALLPPNRMPKRGRAGSERSRIAMLHAFAHIEYVAIDLAFDCAGRFGEGMPRRFVDDWLSVGADEAMHFALLDRRLKKAGAHYGALPAHDGLWEAAGKTRHDRIARLAVVPMALEARGLDVTPATVARFEAAGDGHSARILTRIYHDEIRHVAIGTKWFESCCVNDRLVPAELWRSLISRHFSGVVKPPFNDSARAQAGLTLDYYGTLATLT